MLGANHIPDEAKMTSNSTTSELSLPNSTSLSLSETETTEFVCAFYNPDFIIWSSLGSFYIPCCVMVFLYARIFRVRYYMLAKESAANYS